MDIFVELKHRFSKVSLFWKFLILNLGLISYFFVGQSNTVAIIATFLNFAIVFSMIAGRSIARSFLLTLITYSVFPLAVIVDIALENSIFKYITLIPYLISVTILIFFKNSIEKFSLPKTNVNYLIGPSFVFALYSINQILRGPDLSWVMSGDARNHVDFIKTFLPSGHIDISGYPGLVNAIISNSLAAHSEVFSQIPLVTYLNALSDFWLLGIFSLMLVFVEILGIEQTTDSKLKSYSAVFAIFACAVVVSPLVLQNALGNGFIPTIFAMVACLAILSLLQDPLGSKFDFWLIALATLCLYFIYPLLVFIGAISVTLKAKEIIIRNYQAKFAKMFEITFFVTFGLSILALTMLNPPTSIASALKVEGRIYDVKFEFLLALVLINVLIIGFKKEFNRNYGVQAICLGSVFTLVWLFKYVEAGHYYTFKTIWLLSALNVFVFLTLVYKYSFRIRKFKFAFLGLAIALVVSWIPVGFETRANHGLLGWVRSWRDVTPEASRQIIKMSSTSENSISWNMYPFDKQQVIDIWLAWNSKESSSLHYWGYSGDVGDPKAVCEIAQKNSPINVWVSSEANKNLFQSNCVSDKIGIRIISE